MDPKEKFKKSSVTSLTLGEWRQAQRRVRQQGVVNGWHVTEKDPPAHGQWVLVCSDPKWGPFSPPIGLWCFYVISKAEFLRQNFPDECNPQYVAEHCANFDGAFLTSDLEHCLVADGPWFPDYWKPLPPTPFDKPHAATSAVVESFEPSEPTRA
jgi:hypothetical protein